MKQEDKILFGFVLILVSVLIIGFILNQVGIKSTCHIKEKFYDDMYCIASYRTNLTNSFDGWIERSHEADRLYEIARQESLEEEREKQKILQQCYDEGSFINESFTIKDYGLNCRKIDYLNNHLMDNFERKDGGYISVIHNGFFTYRKTEANLYQYINDRVMATGKLIENINYHLDCKGIKHNEEIDYFTEEEFVMYYVGECIE